MATAPTAPAERLEEIPARVALGPLEAGDPRYVDISKARGSNQLRKLRIALESCDAKQNRFAKIAFTGHRGSGKSTELLHLEHEVAARFTTVHLYLDDNLIRDCDYTDLLLWLVDELARQFAAKGMPLESEMVQDVANWFAERSLEDIQNVKKSVELEAQAEGSVKYGLFGTGLKLLARIKSTLVGNVEQRKVIRHKLQSYSRDLVEKVNLLLDHAHRVLEKHGKNPEILIVQDNLDRLPVEVSRRLFFDNGDLLKSLRAHCIYTVPIALVLAPWNIATVFSKSFTMPMVRTANRDGSKAQEGIDGLLKIIRHRVVIEFCFTSVDVATYLVTMCGGSVRDLMRLLELAQVSARADDKTQIDDEAARDAAKDLRIEFQRLLHPAQTYYPLLAQIHATKRDYSGAEISVTSEDVKEEREFFSQLLFNGTVLEYNGDESWFDVHPAVRDIRDFKDASARLQRIAIR